MRFSSALSVALAVPFVYAAPAPAPELDARQGFGDIQDLGGYISSAILSALAGNGGVFATSTNVDTSFTITGGGEPTTSTPVMTITPTVITSNPLTFITPTPTTIITQTTGTTSNPMATTTPAAIDVNGLTSSILDYIYSILAGGGGIF